MDRNAIRTPELEVHLLTCKEVEEENDDEDENDWGSGGREPSIAGIVCLKAMFCKGRRRA
jgi:hypothetical protein